MKRIGIFSTSQRQQPFIVFASDSWRIWIAYNQDVTSGTYLDLQFDGTVDRVTVHKDQIMNIVRITDAQ